MQGRAMQTEPTLEARYAEVRERIARAAERSGRRPEQVILIAVTKNAESDDVRTLLELGHRDFGENRVQPLLQRQAMVEEFAARLRALPQARQGRAARDAEAVLTGRATAGDTPGPVRWHMIGHLQRNKVRRIIGSVRLIHSVDSLRLAEEIQAAALKRDTPVEVLVQVNCSGESQKFGCPIAAALPLAEQIETMVNVRVRGLMTMAAFSDNPEDARPAFARCRELFEEIRTTGIGEGRFDLLSMGMTGDFEVAIEEGANLVRIGTAIFGPAKHDDGGED